MNSINIIIFTVAVVIATISETHGAESIECPKICPDNLEPICGTDGLDYEKFDNHCEMKMFNCNRQRSALSTYNNTDMDWCITTELRNGLEMFSQNPSESEKLCIKPCPLMFRPVCASNGIHRTTFSNVCEMETFDCMHKAQQKNGWRLLKKSSCSD